MNNEQKNSYVKLQITKTMIALLKTHEFSDISISQITATANVSRNSFYRNYCDKEDILSQYLRTLYTDWEKSYHAQGKQSNNEMYASLFAHLKENSDFYLLLKKQGLFHLFLNVLLEQAGAKPEQDNLSAYLVSFITYGTYGWIEQWIERGMQESAESMSALLSSNGLK